MTDAVLIRRHFGCFICFIKSRKGRLDCILRSAKVIRNEFQHDKFRIVCRLF